MRLATGTSYVFVETSAFQVWNFSYFITEVRYELTHILSRLKEIYRDSTIFVNDWTVIFLPTELSSNFHVPKVILCHLKKYKFNKEKFVCITAIEVKSKPPII